MSVNKVILIGNLGNDPEMKYLPSGEQVANFSIATSEQWNDRNTGEKRERTEWHRLVAFRRQAELIGQYCRKGSKVYVEGRLQTRSWNDQTGQARYVTEIMVDQIQFLSPKNQAADEQSYGGSAYQAAAPTAAAPRPAANKPASSTPPDAFHADEDIPF